MCVCVFSMWSRYITDLKYLELCCYDLLLLVSKSELPWWLSGKEPASNAGDTEDAGSIPGSGISLGVRHNNWIQYSCLGNPMIWGAWWATVHRIAKSQTRMKWLSMYSNWGFNSKNTLLKYSYVTRHVLSVNGGYNEKYTTWSGNSCQRAENVLRKTRLH